MMKKMVSTLIIAVFVLSIFNVVFASQAAAKTSSAPPGTIEAVTNLKNAVQGLTGVSKGIISSLNQKLKDTITLLNQGNLNGAVMKLTDFIKEVNADKQANKLTAAQATQLTAEAAEIIALIQA
jgi:hypothetical protein